MPIENKYNLQIRANWFRTPEQYQGNGAFTQFVEGCIEENGKNFRVFPLRSQFWMEVGTGKELVLWKKIRVRLEKTEGKTNDDIFIYEVDPDVFIKYANELIDSYKESLTIKT